MLSIPISHALCGCMRLLNKIKVCERPRISRNAFTTRLVKFRAKFATAPLLDLGLLEALINGAASADVPKDSDVSSIVENLSGS